MGLIGDTVSYLSMFEDIWQNPEKIYAKASDENHQFRTTTQGGFQYRDLKESNGKNWSSLTKANFKGSLLGTYRVWIEAPEKLHSEKELDRAIGLLGVDKAKVTTICNRLMDLMKEKYGLEEKE